MLPGFLVHKPKRQSQRHADADKNSPSVSNIDQTSPHSPAILPSPFGLPGVSKILALREW